MIKRLMAACGVGLAALIAPAAACFGSPFGGFGFPLGFGGFGFPFGFGGFSSSFAFSSMFSSMFSGFGGFASPFFW